MPKDYPRIESHVSRDTKQRLELLRQELMEKTGKHIPMGKLIESILLQFLEKETCIPDEKK